MDRDTALGSGNKRPARWSLRLFGGFELNELAGGDRAVSLGKRERVLLAYLILSPNCRTSRRKLVTLLWGDAADDTTLDNLRNCLWGLRKALGDTEHRWVASEGDDVVLDASAFEVDALVFRCLAAQSDRKVLEEATKLCAGELLDGLDIDSEEFESWRRAEATRYRDQTIEVLNRLMTQLAECGEAERAIETGLRILQLEPLHEPAVRRLMRLYVESGRRQPAIQLYRTLSDALKTELDAQPEAETRAVFAEIARGGDEGKPVAVSSGAVALVLQAAADIAQPKPLPYPPSVAADSEGAPVLPSTPPQALGSVMGVVERVAPSNTRRPSWIVAGVAAAVVAFLFYQFVQTVGGTTVPKPSQAEAVSIAVLPFVNLSSDKEQEFFSDGMTEEITAALAKIPSLRVVGRTSAFQFKGKNEDLRSIGQALSAANLLEGSVRKDGNEVRITAQLIAADSGVHLWAENYDRELKGVFAIQEEIATAIAGSLRVPLGLRAGESLVSNRTSDTDSYEDYLRALALLRGAGSPEPGGPLTEAAKLLERVVARDPNYAPAWGLLGQVYGAIPGFSAASSNGSTDELRRIRAESLQKAEAAAQKAIRLDPNDIDGYTALAYVPNFRGLFVQAEDLYKQALSLDPGNPGALNRYANMLAVVGRVKESLAMRQRLQAQEPLVPIYNQATASLLWENGRNDEAMTTLKTLLGLPGARFQLAEVYASVGRYSEAADVLRGIPSGSLPPGAVEEAVRLLIMAPPQAASPQTILRRTALGFVYLYVGASDRVLDFYEGFAEAGNLGSPVASHLWAPPYAPVRKTERFKAYVRKLGLVNYWRARGWPEFCHPTTGDDLACE